MEFTTQPSETEAPTETIVASTTVPSTAAPTEAEVKSTAKSTPVPSTEAAPSTETVLKSTASTTTEAGMF